MGLFVDYGVMRTQRCLGVYAWGVGDFATVAMVMALSAIPCTNCYQIPDLRKSDREGCGSHGRTGGRRLLYEAHHEGGAQELRSGQWRGRRDQAFPRKFLGCVVVPQ